ncbi:MAG: hypothetical protein MUF64_04930 [Polyangiaceae bacterium]|jgi:hypothetical protein|nr:hypothetical protein [Polyangiaceae bacterium]
MKNNGIQAPRRAGARAAASRREVARPLLSALLLAAACNNDEAPRPATLALDPGQEVDAWTTAPLPSEAQVFHVQEGAANALTRAPWPALSIELPELTAGSRGAFRVELRDGTGAVALLGLSPPLSSDQLPGQTIPILCGRVGAFARPARGTLGGWQAPALGLVLDRYLLLASSTPEPSGLPSELYDLATLTPLAGQNPLPRAPDALLASRSGMTLLVNAQGATLLDLSTGDTSEVPSNLTQGVLGGTVIRDGQGGAFLLGATRLDGDPSAAILRLDAQGKLSQLSLQTPRRGASAAWLDGTGLIVAGGLPEASVEVLPPGASAFVSTGLLVPATLGATLVPLTSNEMRLLGGTDPDGAPRPSVKLSLGCTGGCTAPTPLGDELPFASLRGYPLGDGKALVLGETDAGTEAVLLSLADPPRQVPLRTPRRGASSIELPDRRVVVVGGVDGAGVPVASIEVFLPP